MNNLLLIVALSGMVFAKDPADSSIIAPVGNVASLAANDSRLVKISDADAAVMPPLYDVRGCPRWKLSGGNVVFIALAQRVVPQASINAAWDDLSDWRARGADTLLSVVPIVGTPANPAIYAHYQDELARRQAVYDNLVRAGIAADDPPVTPSKTSITPQ